MRRLLAVAAVALTTAASASGASSSSIPLKIGDAIDVLNTKVACYAINSNGKDGVACVLLDAKGRPLAGSFGAGLAIDGTAVLTKINKDGTSTQVFKRKAAARRTVYRVRPGDVFGIQITSKVALGCHVLNVTSTLVEPLYRGVKVSCWRATATTPLAKTYGISISDKFAGAFRFDARGRVTTWGVVHKQP